jgi:hypothetical protein
MASSTFSLQMTGTGDADLYVRFGAAPTTSSTQPPLPERLAEPAASRCPPARARRTSWSPLHAATFHLRSDNTRPEAPVGTDKRSTPTAGDLRIARPLSFGPPSRSSSSPGARPLGRRRYHPLARGVRVVALQRSRRESWTIRWLLDCAYRYGKSRTAGRTPGGRSTRATSAHLHRRRPVLQVVAASMSPWPRSRVGGMRGVSFWTCHPAPRTPRRALARTCRPRRSPRQPGIDSNSLATEAMAWMRVVSAPTP